jgi:diguanylate cyclase (GGDEF)-like protein
VALNKCNPGSAVSRAENLREKIAGRPIQTANKLVSATISMGLALSTEFTECTIEEIMHHADMALYAAKRRAQLRAGSTPLRYRHTHGRAA